MQASEDSFRALARSSPWRFSTLHFTRRSGRDAVEAWLERPGWLRVVDGSGRERIEEGVPYTRSTLVVASREGAREGAQPPRQHEPAFPHEVTPSLRPDGLIDSRPDGSWIYYDDPMYENYTWVAMLDPVELSAGTTVAELGEDSLFGRPVWRARMTAVGGYQPRCSCCPLLWGEVSDDLEYGDGPRRPARRAYPSAYDVALDVGTGVVVALAPVDGDRRDLAFEVEIHEVSGWPQTSTVPPERQ